jgi:hypothetical protein
MGDKKTDCKDTEEKCPIGLEIKLENMKEDFDKTAILLHDIAYIKIQNGETDEEGKPTVKTYHISQVLKWILEATETKRKILQTEKIWHKSKWIINGWTFIKWFFKITIIPALLGLLLSIAVSYVKVEAYMKKIDNLEENFMKHLNDK